MEKNKSIELEKTYIGDGVYAWFDGYHIVLTTNDGNEIFVDSQVFEGLINYSRRVNNAFKTEIFQVLDK